MNPKIEISEQLVRDVLTAGQIHWIQEERKKGRVQLICMVDNNGSFGGYFPMNAGLRDGLKPNYLDNGKLDTMPIVTGG